MLPRKPAYVRSGRRSASWARRRTDPVATRPPTAISPRRAPTMASRGSPRSGTPASSRPVGGNEGRSLAEWTARSARPDSTAASTSLTNTPFPPIVQIGMSWRRSPAVSTRTYSGSTFGSTARTRPATCSACQRASGLRRVAIRNFTVRPPAWRGVREAEAPAGAPRPPIDPAPPVDRQEALEPAEGRRLEFSQVEELAERLRQALAPRRPRRILEPHRRLVQQLGHDALGERLDRGALAVVEPGQPSGQPVELGPAHGLGLLAHRQHQRRHLSGGRLGHVLVELVVENAASPFGLAATVIQVRPHEAADVVDVEQGEPRYEVGRQDVAGHG